VLEASGSFTTFAAEYIRGEKIEPGWQLPPQVLDRFQAWLADRSIQPGIAEWSSNRDFIETRLKGEIYNLALGVDQGDEVEAHIDPPILKAIEAITKAGS